MRKKLVPLKDERKKFTATFKRLGSKRNFKGALEKTVLLENICDEQQTFLTQHAWLNFTASFASVGFLKEGDKVEFEARVKPYEKGYVNKKAGLNTTSIDYRLSHPTKVKIIKTAE